MEESNAIVAISFADHVIYNIVEMEGEFDLTGESIISHLRYDRNGFVAEIIASQSHESIEFIDDEHVIFSDFLSSDNKNECFFSDLYRMMYSETGLTDFFYIYDIIQDVLLIKTPEIPNPMIIDYKNDEDLDHFRHLLEG